MLYYSLAAFGLMLAFVAKGRALWLVFLAASLVSALRFGVGPDYFAYEYMYEQWSSDPVQEVRHGVGDQEVGFRFMGSLWKGTGLGFPAFVAICALVNLTFVAATCRRYSPNPTLSFTLYLTFHFLVWTFSGIRQGVVMAVGIHLLLLALDHQTRRSSLIFWLVSALLVTIHSSAVVLWVMYLVARIDLSRRSMLLMSGAAIGLALLPNQVIASAVQRLPVVGDRAVPYLSEGTSGILDFQGLVRLLLLLMILIFYGVATEGPRIRKAVVQLYIFSFTVYFGLQFSELIAARMSIYGRYLDILVFPFILYSMRTEAMRAVFAVGLSVYSMMYFTKELERIDSSLVVRSHLEDPVVTPYTHYWNTERFHFTRKISEL